MVVGMHVPSVLDMGWVREGYCPSTGKIDVLL